MDGEATIALEQRMRRLEQTVRVFCAALVLAVGVLTLRLISMAPKFSRIFKDMLGSEDQLPGFTKIVLGLSSNPLIFYGVPLAIMIGGLFAASKVPGSNWLGIYAACVAALIGIWFALSRALFLPMVKIIQGVAGGY